MKINNSVKTLLAAMLIGMSTMGSSFTRAEEILPEPTLDKLHNAGAKIPSINEIYPESLYSLTEVFPSDIINLAPNVIKYYDANLTDGSIHYYEINFKNSIYGEGEYAKYLKWDKDDNGAVLVETVNPAEAVLTIKYNTAEDYERITADIDNPISSINEVFAGQKIENAISTKGVINNISSKFVGNTLDTSNYTYEYSAILTEAGELSRIDDINSSFIGNTVTVNSPTKSYGAFIKSMSEIGNLKSEFIGNRINAETNIFGGAVVVKPYGIIKNIQSDFINNSISATGNTSIEGGLIGTEAEGQIGVINSSRFIGNYAVSDSGNIDGGVIYNGGTITDGINDTVFSYNYGKSNSGNVRGGVISNEFIGDITNSTFIGNYAESVSGNAYGGAIYADTNLTISAKDHKITEFTGNYVINNGVKDNQAIYVSDAINSTLTLNAENYGQILMNDNINGEEGYRAVLTGDNTGTIFLYDNIYNAHVNIKNVNINIADEKIFNYNFLSLNSEDTASYTIDIDFVNQKADNFTFGSSSQGVVNIDNLNVLGLPTESSVIKILSGSNNIKIALAQNLINKFDKVSIGETLTTYDDVKSTSYWSDKYDKHIFATTVTEGIRTAISSDSGVEDSIEYFVESEYGEIKTESMGDTIRLLAEKVGNRTFKTDDISEVYTMTEDSGIVNKGNFDIYGAFQGDNFSTIDAGGHKFLNVSDGAKVNLSKLKITNTSDADGSVLNVDEGGYVRFGWNNQIDASCINGIVNNGTIESGSTTTSNTGITGTGTFKLFQNNTKFTFTDGASVTQDKVIITDGGQLDMGTGALTAAIEMDNGRIWINADNLHAIGDVKLSGGDLHFTEGTINSNIRSVDNKYGNVFADGYVIANAIIEANRFAGSGTLEADADLLKVKEFYDLKNLILTGGTLSNTKMASWHEPKINITGGVTIGEGNQLSGMTVESKGSVTSDASYLSTLVLEEGGIANLTGGALTANLSGAGVVNIQGEVSKLGGNQLQGKTLNIEEGSKLITVPNNIRFENIVNDSVLQFSDGTFLNDMNGTLSGNGHVVVNTASNKTFVNNKLTMTQEVKVTEGSNFQTNLNFIGDEVLNEGKIIATGGTLTHAINGATGVLEIRDKTYLEAPVYGNILISSANNHNLYSSPEYLNYANSIENNWYLYFYTGTLKKNIDGTGTIYVLADQNVQVDNVDISTNYMELSNNSTLTISASNLKTPVNKMGTGAVLNLLDGELDYDIFANGNNRTNIVGNVINNNKRISTAITVNGGGSFTTNIENLFNSNVIVEENGKLYLSGESIKQIQGVGTTYIDKNLTFSNNGARINGIFDFNGGTLSTITNQANQNYINKATGEGFWIFDIGWGKDFDKLDLKEESDAVIKVDAANLNYVGIPNFDTPTTSNEMRLLLNNQNASLEIVNNKIEYGITKSSIDNASFDVYYDENFAKRTWDGVVTGELERVTKDSVRLKDVYTVWGEEQVEQGDLLAAWAKLATDEKRYFRFRDTNADIDYDYVNTNKNNRYTLSENIGQVTDGEMHIIGVKSQESSEKSVIDLVNNDGFIIHKNQYLDISDVKFENIGAERLITAAQNGTIGYYDSEGNFTGGLTEVSASGNQIAFDSAHNAGAILQMNSSAAFQIKDSEFNNNIITKLHEDEYSDAGIYGSLFDINNNSVIGDFENKTGGIISSTFNNNTIEANLADSSSRSISINGGLIRLNGSSKISNILNSNFENNNITANNNVYGGIIEIDNSIIDSIKDIKFLNNTIESKLAGAYGGSIYLNSTNSKINTIENVSFENNKIITSFPDNYTWNRGAGIYNNAGTIGDIINSNFTDNSSLQGAGIFMRDHGVINNISDTVFEKNSAVSGGAIYSEYSSLGNFKNVEFNNNTAEIGGSALYIYGNGNSENGYPSFDNVKFNNNITKSETINSWMVGAVYLYTATIDKITNSEFVGNTVEQNSANLAGGSALHLSKSCTINEISNTLFSKNTVNAKHTSSGALAVVDNSHIGKISNSEFSDNKVTIDSGANVDWTDGGAIKIANGGKIDEISDTIFERNSLTRIAGPTFVRGGAISNTTSGMVLKNVIFKDNYVLSKNNSQAYGGAIWTSASIDIVASGEDGLTEFTGNYAESTNSGGKIHQAIYTSGANVNLTFTAEDGGRILLNDYVYSDNSNAKVYLNGDENSTISLYNNISNSNVIANGHVNIDMMNDDYHNYSFKKLTSSDTTKYGLDISFTDKLSDTIEAQAGSSGTILIDKLNLRSDLANNTVQILHSNNSDIQLALAQELKDKDGNSLTQTSDVLLTLGNTVHSKDTIHQDEGIGLTTTNTTNDSIVYFVDKNYDTFWAASTSSLYDDKIFAFEQAGETYVISEDISGDIVVPSGTFNIKGVKGDTITNTLDFSKSNSYLNLSNNNTVVNISNVKLYDDSNTTSLIYLNSNKVEINLDNVIVDGNITALRIEPTINIVGKGAEFTNNSILHNNINAYLKEGTLKFGVNTFSDGATLFAEDGNINFANDTVEEYRISRLSSSEKAKYSIDVDLNQGTSDKIIILGGNYSNEGPVTIDSINFVNMLPDGVDEFETQVLYNNSDNQQLAISENLKDYKLKNISRIETDTILADTSFNDLYYTRERNGELYGTVSLATTRKENDSLNFKTVEDWEVSTTIVDSMGDTLKLINQAADYNTRSFKSDNALETYIVTEDIGKTAQGSFTLQGVSADDEISTIDFKEYSGFEVGADTSLNFNEIKIISDEQNGTLIHVTDGSAKVNLSSSIIEGTIIGDELFNLNISGLGTTGVTGDIINTNVTLNKGTFTFSENTLSDSNTIFNADGGIISLKNDNIENYNIYNLNATDKSGWIIDVDLGSQTADTITVENKVNNNDTNIIKLEQFNLMGNLDSVKPGDDYTIRILNSKDDSTQLQLSETLLSQLNETIKIGSKFVVDSIDVINPISNWNKDYYKHGHDDDVFGQLNIIKDKTENDSLHLFELYVKAGEKRDVLGDTLKLLSQLETTQDRDFIFNSHTNEYLLTENIGEVTEGIYSLTGVTGEDSNGNIKHSVINMDKNDGFALSKKTTMNVSDITFVDSPKRNGSLFTLSNEDAVLNLNNVKITNTLSSYAISNSAVVNMTGGDVILDTGIIGTGVTNITGADVVFKNGSLIRQKEVNVNEGSLTLGSESIIHGALSVGTQGSATISTKALTNSAVNDGNINLTGGNLQYNINGDGVTNIVGTVINNAKILQNVDIKKGSLKTQAENISGKINNDADLLIQGKILNTITGAGKTTVNENITLASGANIDGTLNLNDGKVFVNDGATKEYYIGAMENNGSASIDFDFENRVADKFIVENDSAGRVYIEDINFLNMSNIDDSVKVQVLDTNGTDNLQLTLNKEISDVDYKLGRTSKNEDDVIKNRTNYKDLYYNYTRGGDIYGNLQLGTTKTTNDSLIIKMDDSKTVWDEDKTKGDLLGDTLALWNSLDTNEDKRFVIDNIDKYVVSSDLCEEGLGTTKGKNVTIEGVSKNENSKSVIDLNNKKGFELSEDTTLSIINTKLTGNETLINVSDENAKVNLQNAYIDGNIIGEQNFDLDISGKDITKLDGVVTNANSTLTSGGLKFNTDTFASSDDTLNIKAGNVELANGLIEDYIINELTSSKDANYSIDINLTGNNADKIIITSGSGIVKLDNLNIVGSIADLGTEYKIQILKTDSKDIQLDLSDNVKSQLDESYLIGTSTEITTDSLKEFTHWKDTYKEYSQELYTYGKLELTDTNTTNDSIGIVVTGTDKGKKIDLGNLDDTLKYVNNSSEIDTKTFFFDKSTDEYKVTSDLEETVGSVIIKGVRDEKGTSSIDLQNHSGFELTADSKLNINNTAMKNGNAERGSVINAVEKGAEITLTNVNLLNNTATGTQGAAVYSKSDVTLNADGADVKISGNKTSLGYEAIYQGEDTVLTLNAVNNGKFTINDKINGSDGYKTHITGDATGKIILNERIDNSEISMDSVTLRLSGGNNFENSDFTISSGVLDLINNSVQQQVAKSFTVNGNFNVNVDVDLNKVAMDRLPENTVINSNAIINVDKMNLLSDTKADSVAIPFAYHQFKDNVNYIGYKELSKNTQITTAYAPIYKYNVSYESRDDLGYFVFSKGGGYSPSSYNAFNPSIMAGSVAAQAGGFAAVNETFNYVFEHSDAMSMLPRGQRLSMQYDGLTAINDSSTKFSAILNKLNEEAVWYQPYVNFENIGLQNGPSVNVTSYGSLVGGDSRYKRLNKGWGTVSTAYIGYNGSQQNYSSISTTQNGGLFGVTQTFYKKDFFTALTASVGASAGESSTMYGHENFTMLMSGVASKSGYNFEFKQGKYILQPTLLLSYSMVKTFDYTNAAGVRINSEPLHTIQVHPQLKLAANLKNGWQPYFNVGFVYNVLNDTKVKANDVILPELSVKPYVEYGLGVQKRWNDNFSGHLQAMIRNGGRNGIMLTAGFRWAIGKDGIKKETTQKNLDKLKTISNNIPERTVIKKLTR